MTLYRPRQPKNPQHQYWPTLKFLHVTKALSLLGFLCVLGLRTSHTADTQHQCTCMPEYLLEIWEKTRILELLLQKKVALIFLSPHMWLCSSLWCPWTRMGRSTQGVWPLTFSCRFISLSLTSTALLFYTWVTTPSPSISQTVMDAS